MEKKPRVVVNTCGVPTPHMGPWKRVVREPKGMPRYAKVDGLAVPDVALRRMHLDERKTALEISREIGEPYFFVRARLRNLKIFNTKIKPFRRKIDNNMVVILYQKGFSPREIGRFMKVDRGTITRRLKKIGLLMRNRTPVEYVKAKIGSGEFSEDALKRFSCRRGKDRWRGKR